MGIGQGNVFSVNPKMLKLGLDIELQTLRGVRLKLSSHLGKLKLEEKILKSVLAHVGDAHGDILTQIGQTGVPSSDKQSGKDEVGLVHEGHSSGAKRRRKGSNEDLDLLDVMAKKQKPGGFVVGGRVARIKTPSECRKQSYQYSSPSGSNGLQNLSPGSPERADDE